MFYVFVLAQMRCLLADFTLPIYRCVSIHPLFVALKCFYVYSHFSFPINLVTLSNSSVVGVSLDAGSVIDWGPSPSRLIPFVVHFPPLTGTPIRSHLCCIV